MAKISFLARLSTTLLLVSQSLVVAAADDRSTSCRCLPGDSCWPTISEWKTLNSSIGGRLIATSPLGKPCHDPTYNATECEILQGEWLMPQLHMESSSSVMAPFFANQSCDPWQPKSRPCTLGNYVRYAVMFPMRKILW
ncbi:isoamyl alcohol oxidase protein [Rutstroemia sp. NJR-2017a WRK4]|nr:isoamyl alcohol oxidase protein [Rutstroemia sp. NJR-2017a WRK4]